MHLAFTARACEGLRIVPFVTRERSHMGYFDRSVRRSTPLGLGLELVSELVHAAKQVFTCLYLVNFRSVSIGSLFHDYSSVIRRIVKYDCAVRRERVGIALSVPPVVLSVMMDGGLKSVPIRGRLDCKSLRDEQHT